MVVSNTHTLLYIRDVSNTHSPSGGRGLVSSDEGREEAGRLLRVSVRVSPSDCVVPTLRQVLTPSLQPAAIRGLHSVTVGSHQYPEQAQVWENAHAHDFRRSLKFH